MIGFAFAGGLRDGRQQESTSTERLHRRSAWRSVAVAIAVVTDALVIAGANALTNTFERAWHWDEVFHLRPAYVNSTLYMGGILLFVSFTLGLYRSMFRTSWLEHFHLAAKMGLYGGIPIVLIQFFLHFKGYDTSYFVFFFVLVSVLFIVGRTLIILAHQSLERRDRAITPALVLRGSPHDDPSLTLLRKWSRDLGIRLDALQDAYTADEYHESSYRSDWKANAPDNCEHVFISSPNGNRELISDAVAWCKSNRVGLHLLSGDIDTLFWFLGIRDVTGIPLVSVTSPVVRKINRFFKRLLDLLIALTMIIICLPLFAVIAVAILIEDGGPVIYRQRRALLPGTQEFWMYKFRSMKTGSESQHAELSQKSETSPGLFFLRRDPRVTAVGRIIRKLSMDELPQLFNVLKGDMSIVGPRPLMLEDLTQVSPHVFEGGLFSLRKDVHPGLTGLWQISGRRELTVQKMLLLDLYYIEHQSIFFDFFIMARTFLVVLFGKGAY